MKIAHWQVYPILFVSLCFSNKWINIVNTYSIRVTFIWCGSGDVSERKNQTSIKMWRTIFKFIIFGGAKINFRRTRVCIFLQLRYCLVRGGGCSFSANSFFILFYSAKCIFWTLLGFVLSDSYTFPSVSSFFIIFYCCVGLEPINLICVRF